MLNLNPIAFVCKKCEKSFLLDSETERYFKNYLYMDQETSFAAGLQHVPTNPCELEHYCVSCEFPFQIVSSGIKRVNGHLDVFVRVAFQDKTMDLFKATFAAGYLARFVYAYLERVERVTKKDGSKSKKYWQALFRFDAPQYAAAFIHPEKYGQLTTPHVSEPIYIDKKELGVNASIKVDPSQDIYYFC